MEIRLRDHTRRLDQVDVHPSTGRFSYAGIDGVRLNVSAYVWVFCVLTGDVFCFVLFLFSLIFKRGS